jgi:hypothetical protein
MGNRLAKKTKSPKSRDTVPLKSRFFKGTILKKGCTEAVLWIRIRIRNNPNVLAGSESEQTVRIRIRIQIRIQTLL